MARYRNVNSGALVEVRDDKVLDAEWEPADAKKAAAKKTATAKSDNK